jgi:transposase
MSLSNYSYRRRQTISGLVWVNENGGYYQPGRMYQLPKRIKVAEIYLGLLDERAYPLHPSVREVSQLGECSWHVANEVITELKVLGAVEDPEARRRAKNNVLGPGQKLSTVHEMFLLSLRTLDPARPLYNYVQELNNQFGLKVSTQSISDWFHKRWDHRGNLKRANLVPLDKWKPINKLRYYEFVQKLRIYSDHSKYNFIDEKHIFNKDVYSTKVRKNPLTGKLPSIHVSGDFRKAYNIMAVISPNPEKEYPIDYTIGEENGTSEAFVAFMTYLIAKRFLRHNEFVVMDNASIHYQNNVTVIEDMLWETIVDGLPLHILVIQLPTRSPELNPIELVFHILAMRIRSFRYRTAGPVDKAVLFRAAQVMDDMTYALILKCCAHCGY